MSEDLTITVSPEELPGPGETVELVRGDFTILVENTKVVEEIDEPAYGEIVFYTPVETVHSSTRRHAAEVRQKNVRTRVASSTLCSRAGTRRVKRRLREPLSNVTCVQCRALLADEGEV